MILISQNRYVAVRLQNLWVEPRNNVVCIFHSSEDEKKQMYLGTYETETEAVAQIEAIGKALEAGRQVYKFD